MINSQGIGSDLVSFQMIFQALQFELFRFEFHSLSSKILWIPEFNLHINDSYHMCLIEITQNLEIKILVMKSAWIVRNDLGLKQYESKCQRADPLIMPDFLKLQCGLFPYLQFTSRTIKNHKFMFGVIVNWSLAFKLNFQEVKSISENSQHCNFNNPYD